MINISKNELADFFQNYPLYSKIQFFSLNKEDKDFSFYSYIEDKAYKFYCPFENDFHTFKIQKKWGEQFSVRADNAHELSLDNESKLNFSFHIISKCQSCDYKMDLLLNIFTLTPIIQGEQVPIIFLRKIGQLPAFERTPEKVVLDYLNAEDKENYKKALSNLSLSYGIGAFAYLRRVIENEIKNIVKDLSQLEFDGSEKVKQAWEEYEQNHQMSNLIENINPYIPSSLKEIGDNPIKLLYQQLSGGIHEYSEEECLEKAKQIDVLMRYVIRKVNSEKYELNEVRKAMNSLRK